MESDNTQTTTKQETSEVILPPGSTSTVGALSSMFDQIEAGNSEGKSAKDVVKEVSAPAPEPKKEEVKEVVETPKEQTDLSKKLDETIQKKEDDGEVSREKLRAASEEKKEEPKVEAKKEEAVKPEDEVPEDELKVLPADKPKTAKRIQALLRKIDATNSEVATTKKDRDEKAAKLSELEAKLKDVKTVDPTTEAKVKEQLDELQMLRRRYTLDKDPEVKTKYDSRVEAAETSIIETLTRRKAGQGLLDVIKEEGGWIKFSNSTRTIPINDGEGGIKHITSAEVAENILQALPLGERKAVEAAMMEQATTTREKERYFKEQQDTALDYFKKKEEESTRQAADQQKQFEDARKQIEEFERKTLEADWLKDKAAPDKATPAEKAAIEEHNKYNAQLRSVFKKAIKTHDLPGLMEIMTDSVRYYDERRNNTSLRSELAKVKADLAAKQAEIDRFKVGGRSVPKAGSISSSYASNENRPSAPVGIGAAFDALERGETVLRSRGGDDE